MQRLSVKNGVTMRNVWFLIILLSSVITCKNEELLELPNVTSIAPDLKMVNASDLLFRSETEIQEFRLNYPEFSSIYFENVLGIKDSAQIELYKKIDEITKDVVLKGLNDTIRLEFSDLSKVENKLSESF